MTKEKLLNLVKECGSFWYVSDHRWNYWPNGNNFLWFKKDNYSNIDKYSDLIDHCIKDPKCIQIDFTNKRLILLNTLYCDFRGAECLHPSKKQVDVLVNFDEDVALY